MTLVKYIEIHGQARVAKTLGVERSTVCKWHKRESCPTLKVQVEIVKHTQGLVSYKEMIEDYVKYKYKK